MSWFKRLFRKKVEDMATHPSSITLENIRAILVFTTTPVIRLPDPKATMAAPLVFQAYQRYFPRNHAILHAIESRQIPLEYHAVADGNLESTMQQALTVLRSLGKPVIEGTDNEKIVVVLSNDRPVQPSTEKPLASAEAREIIYGAQRRAEGYE